MARQIVVFNIISNTVVQAFLNGEADSSQFAGRADVDLDPNLSTVENILPQKYWKRVGVGTWSPMTGPEQAAVDAAIATAQAAQFHSDASTAVDANDPVSMMERGFSLVTLDEINSLRQWDESLKAAVAAATSFSNLQTRVAALLAMPDRTKTQLITAVKSKITGGGAD